MHSSQIITQSLSSITPKSNNFLATEAKPTTNFNTMLSKEVSNQNKVAPKANNSNNDANKNKLTRQNEATASPPKQELSKAEKSSESNTKSVEESDTQSDATDNTTADASTLLAFVEQLNQLVSPATVESADGIAQENISDAADANTINVSSLIDGENPSVEQSQQNLQYRSLHKKLEAGTPSDAVDQNMNQSSAESNLDSSFKNVIELVAANSDGAKISSERATNQADGANLEPLTMSNNVPASTLIQQQNATTGMNQIVTNAELAATESAAVSTKKTELGVSEVQTGTESTSKVKATKDKTELTLQAQTQNYSTLRDTFSAKLDAHQEKIGDSLNRSEALDNAAKQSNLIEGVQNQAAPSETSKLNETVKSQVAAEHISPRVGSKAWDQAISQKVIWMVAGGEQSAELSLNPPDLGPLQVVLSISDNQVDASFISSHLDVREAIEAAAPKLKEMMDNAGIALSGFSVNAEAKSNPQQFEQSQNNSSRSTNIAQSKQSSISTESAGLPKTSRVQLGSVDTFV